LHGQIEACGLTGRCWPAQKPINELVNKEVFRAVRAAVLRDMAAAVGMASGLAEVYEKMGLAPKVPVHEIERWFAGFRC
jgi:hypothetical protein